MDQPDLEGDDTERLLEFLYVCPIGLIEIDAAGAIGMMNPLATQLLFPIAANGDVSNLFGALAPYAPDLRSLASAFDQERGTVFEHRRIHVAAREDGEALILSSTLIKLDRDRFMVVLGDASDQVAQERRLKQAESWFSIILSGVNDFALLSLDKTGRIASWNQSGERQTGYGKPETLGRTMNIFYYPDEAVQGRALQQVDLARRDGWHIDEGWRRKKDGSRYWCQSLVSALEEATGEITGFSVVMRDVTEKKRDGDEIRKLLTTDHLTGALNRARFFELAEAELARCRRFGQPLSALMVDIDHFKSVNDRHGHAGGDAVLCAVARTLGLSIRSIDLCARMGGEEFALMLPNMDSDGAWLVAERLRRETALLRTEFADQSIPVTISVGSATLQAGCDTIDALLREADTALYEAKAAGRNRVVVSRGRAEAA